MVRARAAAWVVVVTALLLAKTSPADQEPVQLTYDALVGCPPRAEFLRQVAARTPRAAWIDDEPKARHFIVVIAGTLDQPRGALTVLATEGTATRVVQGETCEEVVAALALITAVAIDPQAKLLTPAPPPDGTPAGPAPAPPPGPPSPASPAPAPPEPPVVGPPAAVPPNVPAAATWAPPHPTMAPAPPSGWRWTLGLGATAASGLDALGLQIPVFLDLERAGPDLWSPAFRATMVVAPSREIGHARGAADFRRYAGALSACPLWLKIHPSLGLRPCAAVEAGALLGRGKIDQGLETTTAWVALLLPVRLQWSPATWALLEVQGSFGVPLVQPRFYFEPDTTVVTYDPVFGTIGGAAGVRFP